MNLLQALTMCPHLASPAALAVTDTNGKFQLPKHLAVLNRELVNVPFTKDARLIVNMPFQHGKTWLASIYFTAWTLLLCPEMRIILVAYGDDFASSFGSKVKEIVERFGASVGVVLKKDTKAKDEWAIDGHNGGLVCRGVHGSITGRPADLLILDDLIKNDEEAMSPNIMEKHWQWYQKVAYARLGPTAPIVAVGTRWGTRDIFGRILAEAKDSGEQWKVIKFKAIATRDDILGRKLGEALWPERVPLKRLKMIQERRGKAFDICWQQEPQEEGGGHFRPFSWPVYDDMGDAYSLQEPAHRRTIVAKEEVFVFATVDWATSEKKTSDYTAIGIFGLLPDGRMLVLATINLRVRLEECVPLLARTCRAWRPRLVAAEALGFQASLANECRRYPDIPEVRRLLPESKANAKLRRALPAIVMGENQRIFLPSAVTYAMNRVPGDDTDWLAEFTNQLVAFTGIDDEHDDMVDALAYAAQQAQQLRPATSDPFGEHGPLILTEGYRPF